MFNSGWRGRGACPGSVCSLRLLRVRGQPWAPFAPRGVGERDRLSPRAAGPEGTRRGLGCSVLALPVPPEHGWGREKGCEGISVTSAGICHLSRARCDPPVPSHRPAPEGTRGHRSCRCRRKDKDPTAAPSAPSPSCGPRPAPPPFGATPGRGHEGTLRARPGPCRGGGGHGGAVQPQQRDRKSVV